MTDGSHRHIRGLVLEAIGEWNAVDGDIESLSQIPAVATEVFKHVDLATCGVNESERVFRTSGTTRERRGDQNLCSGRIAAPTRRVAARRSTECFVPGTLVYDRVKFESDLVTPLREFG